MIFHFENFDDERKNFSQVYESHPLNHRKVKLFFKLLANEPISSQSITFTTPVLTSKGIEKNKCDNKPGQYKNAINLFSAPNGTEERRNFL